MAKVVTVRLLAGASCFAQHDTLLKMHPEQQMKGYRRHLAERSPFQAGPPTIHIQGKGRTPSTTSMSALHAQSNAPTEQKLSNPLATSYYLIWSKGFLPKFGLVAAILLGLHWAGIAGHIGLSLSRVWHTHLSGAWQNVLAKCVPNFVLPLLSSSCCLVQLMINALVGAGGCAGFNTILGPVRPTFLALLAYLNWTARPPLATGVVRLSLALLPEMVHFANRWLAYAWQNRAIQAFTNDTDDIITATVEVEIPTMGCVACVQKIDASLRQSAPSQILHATSWLDSDKEKGGRAKVHMALRSREELDSLNESILKSIDSAGFSGSSIVDLQFDENNKQKKQTTE